MPDEISLEDVLIIHREEIDCNGLIHGILDVGTLECLFEFGIPAEKSPWDRAALVLYTIAARHPFHDGNKRTAFIAAHLVLQLSGWEVIVDEDEMAEFVLLVAMKRKSKMQIKKWLRDYAVPLSDLG